MIDPREYNKHSEIQTTNSLLCLQEFEENANWRKQCDTIIDIGCGDGNFTSNFLVKLLPGNFKEVLGCDVNEEMVKFANKHYSSERVRFEILDIGRPLPKQYRNRFEQAFSFYAIHWVKDQEQVFSNIFDLLAPGGECFLLINGINKAFYETYRILSKIPQWWQWAGNAEDIVSPYHNCKKPEEKIMKLMTEIGFVDSRVTYKRTTHIYKNIEDFKDSARAVNVFQIPENCMDDYLNDFAKIAQAESFIDEKNQIDINIIVVQAKKGYSD